MTRATTAGAGGRGVFGPDSILGVVDVQPTFMPGGELPVADGAAVVPVINRLLASRFACAFATQDWHPPGHGSFASAHPGRAPFDTIALAYGPQTLWPDHALAGSANAALHPDLDQRKLAAIIRKGSDPAIDSYSAFFENDHRTPTGLHGFLSERGVRHLFLAGLATDYCVAWSAADALRLGYAVTIIEDACRAIALALPGGGTTRDAARADLLAAGARFVRSGDL
ncbi:MAG: bifunctional nicotinamidase/pyrazinamidase [Rhodospirillales bacterium]|jgi:nicotinamidase/pyrazinamidase|nr:bifunctional nicotinamidase/pyrazinamidase [Rhodospirillales bacterium]